MKTKLIIQLRLVAYCALMAGLLLLTRNLVLSFDSFNPSYLFHYFRQELLLPLLLCGAALITFAAAPCIAKQLLKGAE